MKFPGMKNVWLFFIFLLIIVSACGTPTDYNQVLEDIQENLDFGNLSIVRQLADSLAESDCENKEILRVADSLKQIADRISLDFSVSESQVKKQIELKNGPFTAEEKTNWENKGWLEWRMIDGERKYFNRAASNLRLIKMFREHKDQKLIETGNDPDMVLRLKHTREVLNASDNSDIPVVPVKMKITYSITVHPNVVPDGEIIHCWLPWPKENSSRQKDVKLLESSGPEHIIAPDTAIHSTFYMKQVSKKDIPTVFRISYTYTSLAQSYNLSRIKALPYETDSEDYLKNTSEQLPHICFTDDVRRLADSITGGDDDPVSIVRKIYFWFKENIMWTGALEYSIIPNIPEYVIRNMRGDCGMQDFLFISMLRYKGIPARWQSGWMMPPGSENLHDWCEVYFEGTGWVPVDISYDLQKSDSSSERNFYMSGIDSYRLIVNEGVGGPLHPMKLFLRSEPNDFQRGEVEWDKGNLYFDKWDYDMKIEYLK